MGPLQSVIETSARDMLAAPGNSVLLADDIDEQQLLDVFRLVSCYHELALESPQPVTPEELQALQDEAAFCYRCFYGEESFRQARQTLDALGRDHPEIFGQEHPF